MPPGEEGDPELSLSEQGLCPGARLVHLLCSRFSTDTRSSLPACRPSLPSFSGTPPRVCLLCLSCPLPCQLTFPGCAPLSMLSAAVPASVCRHRLRPSPVLPLCSGPSCCMTCSPRAQCSVGFRTLSFFSFVTSMISPSFFSSHLCILRGSCCGLGCCLCTFPEGQSCLPGLSLLLHWKLRLVGGTFLFGM